MTAKAVALESVVEQLRGEGLLSDAAAADGFALVESLRSRQPWYLRALVGFGAWLASLLLIGFVAGFSLSVGGATFTGLLLIVAAVVVRRRPQTEGNDFVVQSALAVSLAGQALFAWGTADLLANDSFEFGCVLVMLVCGTLFVLFPDRIHRVLMVLVAATALVSLLYALEWNAMVPVVGPLAAAGFVVIHANRGRLIAAGHGDYLLPLEAGLMLGAFGSLLLSTIYVLPEVGSGFRFYPRPWISTLLLGALLLYVGGQSFARILGEREGRAPILVYLLLVAVSAAAWAAPGLLLALLVIIVGAAAGHRSVAGTGIAFFAIFVATYFYGIEVSLFLKSVTLVASGVVILVARWLLLATLGRSAP